MSPLGGGYSRQSPVRLCVCNASVSYQQWRVRDLARTQRSLFLTQAQFGTKSAILPTRSICVYELLNDPNPQLSVNVDVYLQRPYHLDPSHFQ